MLALNRATLRCEIKKLLGSVGNLPFLFLSGDNLVCISDYTIGILILKNVLPNFILSDKRILIVSLKMVNIYKLL